MAQWLTVLVTQPDDLNSVPGTHSGREEPGSESYPLTYIHTTIIIIIT